MLNGDFGKIQTWCAYQEGRVGLCWNLFIHSPHCFFQHLTHSHHHANGTAILNRTTQRLPHSYAPTSRLQFCFPHQFPPLPSSCPLCLPLHSCQLQGKILQAVFNISTACVVCRACFLRASQKLIFFWNKTVNKSFYFPQCSSFKNSIIPSIWIFRV